MKAITKIRAALATAVLDAVARAELQAVDHRTPWGTQQRLAELLKIHRQQITRMKTGGCTTDVALTIAAEHHIAITIKHSGRVTASANVALPFAAERHIATTHTAEEDQP